MVTAKRVRWLATILLIAVAGSVIAWTVLDHRWGLFYSYDAIAYGVVAPALAVALGVPAVWSRTFAINVAIIVALLAAVEAGSWVVAPPPPRKDIDNLGGDYQVRDDSIGYRAVPNFKTRVVEHIEGQLVYDVTYEIDAYGRRVVPFDESRAAFAALFLGGSFIFALGVAGEDTAPAAFARTRPEYRPYVYALGGYGPSQALDQFRLRDIDAEVPEPIRLVIYYMIESHVDRVIGTTDVAVKWCGRCANYEGVDAQDLIRVGSFNESRPLTTAVQSVLTRSNFIRAIGFTIPDPKSKKAYRRTAAVLEALRDEVAKAAPEARFVVAMHLATEYHTGPLRRMLEARGIEVIGFPGLYDASDPRYILAEFNRHPSAAAHELIGRALAERLQ